MIKPGSKGPLTALKRPERRSVRDQKAAASLADAKGISTDVLSKLGGIFTLKVEQKKQHSGFSLMVKVFLLCSQLGMQNSGHCHS